MGCGCSKNKAAKATVMSAPAPTTPKAANTAACIKKYDELAALDKKLIALHRRFRFVGGTSYRYAEMQKVVRTWITELKDHCPDETDLASYTEYVNTEYAKYF